MRKCYAPSVCNRLQVPGCLVLLHGIIAEMFHQFFISLRICFQQKEQPVFVQANAGFVFAPYQRHLNQHIFKA